MQFNDLSGVATGTGRRHQRSHRQRTWWQPRGCARCSPTHAGALVYNLVPRGLSLVDKVLLATVNNVQIVVKTPKDTMGTE